MTVPETTVPAVNIPPVAFGPARPAIAVSGLGKAFRIGLPPAARPRRTGLRKLLHAPLAGFRGLAKLDVAAEAAAAHAAGGELAGARPVAAGDPSYIGPVRPAPDPSAWRCLRDIDLMSATARRPAVEHDLVWALRDVTFSVGEGQVVGVVGRNGAGKSTLLKVLSRITDPTVGRAEIRGRVCSLLEVGTGFHKELTGRENVYMNGTVLGMTRREIDAAFEEIVDFSGVEEFLDTPVKRYSSGMKVRLAFSVAAHLRPEILIVDEVLAVGDAEFQEKCLGKMQDVAAGGRTVLFVSHNMKAVRTLCTRAVVLSGGRVLWTGPVEDPFPPAKPAPVADAAVDADDEPEDKDEPARVTPYVIRKADRVPYEEPEFVGEADVDLVGPWRARFTAASVRGPAGDPVASVGYADAVRVRVEYELAEPHPGLVLSVKVFDAPGGDWAGCGGPAADGRDGPVRLVTTTRDAVLAGGAGAGETPDAAGAAGRHAAEVELPGGLLNAGTVYLQPALVVPGVRPVARGPKLRLAIEPAEFVVKLHPRGRFGAVAVALPWTHAHAPAAADGAQAGEVREAAAPLRRAA